MSRGLMAWFALINLAGAALLAGAWRAGWVEAVIDADRSRLVLVIAAAFLCGLALAGWRARRLTALHGLIAEWLTDPDFKTLRHTYKREVTGILMNRPLVRLRWLANALVLLGLIGTVIGFVIALQGVDPATVGDPSAIGPMVGTLINGMGIALYTTLAGAVFNLWLSANILLLSGATGDLRAALIDLEHPHA